MINLFLCNYYFINLGVIEASNKMQGRFTLDDEALLLLISMSLNDIISNSYH